MTGQPPGRPSQRGLRFTRHHRLSRSRDYSRVFRRATRVAGGSLTILARPNTLGHPRLGLAISRKHARRATARNRIKRVVRESFRQHQQMLDGLDVVVISRKGIAERDKGTLRADLDRLWQELSRQCAR